MWSRYTEARDLWGMWGRAQKTQKTPKAQKNLKKPTGLVFFPTLGPGTLRHEPVRNVRTSMAAGQPSFRLQVERARVRPRNSAFSLAMAATRATSLVDKMHYCNFLITRAGTSATSLVDKMHFCKKSWSNQSSDIVSTFSLTMAATSATSSVDKIHYCKTMERERVRLQISAF